MTLRLPRSKELRHSLMKDVVARSIAAQIVGLRLRAGLTQAALAAGLRTKQSAIAKWESGTYDGWRVRTLVAIAKFFDVALIIRFTTWREWLLAFTAHGPVSIPPSFNVDQLPNPPSPSPEG
jgi:transcriptional regulator with XRE-family HTH domain